MKFNSQLVFSLRSTIGNSILTLTEPDYKKRVTSDSARNRAILELSDLIDQLEELQVTLAKEES